MTDKSNPAPEIDTSAGRVDAVDIVERLRQGLGKEYVLSPAAHLMRANKLFWVAADEIERLRAAADATDALRTLAESKASADAMQAEIKRLRAVVAAYSENNDMKHKQIEHAHDEVLRLRAEVEAERSDHSLALAEVMRLNVQVEALRKDAGRYRWLRANCVRERTDHGDLELSFACSFEHYNDVDAAIDAQSAS